MTVQSSSMVRRLLRIFCVVGLVVLLGTAVVGQFWGFVLVIPDIHVSWDSTGLQLGYGSFNMWMAERFPDGPWSVQDPFSGLPEFSRTHARGHTYSGVFLPWWLVLSTWCLLTIIILRMTRRRKVGTAFPIEPTAKPR